jgi:hypothetical protein
MSSEKLAKVSTIIPKSAVRHTQAEPDRTGEGVAEFFPKGTTPCRRLTGVAVFPSV